MYFTMHFVTIVIFFSKKKHINLSIKSGKNILPTEANCLYCLRLLMFIAFFSGQISRTVGNAFVATSKKKTYRQSLP